MLEVVLGLSPPSKELYCVRTVAEGADGRSRLTQQDMRIFRVQARFGAIATASAHLRSTARAVQTGLKAVYVWYAPTVIAL